MTVVVFLPGEAFAIEANGLVTIPKTPHATCPPDESLTQAQLNAGIAVVNAQGQLVQNAIRVQTLLGQQIILAGCRLG